MKSLFNVEGMGVEVERPWTVNFDIIPRSFTVILLIIFDFEHFLT